MIHTHTLYLFLFPIYYRRHVLLIGPEGCGKKSTARLAAFTAGFFNSYNCLRPYFCFVLFYCFIFHCVCFNSRKLKHFCFCILNIIFVSCDAITCNALSLLSSLVFCFLFSFRSTTFIWF